MSPPGEGPALFPQSHKLAARIGGSSRLIIVGFDGRSSKTRSRTNVLKFNLVEATLLEDISS